MFFKKNIRRRDVPVKKIIVYIAAVIIIISASFFAGSITTKHRLVAEHRQQLELIRSRTEQYESIYRQARETNRELGECLSKSAATLSGLRLQISEVRTRYEAMENLLDSSFGSYDFTSGSFYSADNNTCHEITGEDNVLHLQDNK